MLWAMEACWDIHVEKERNELVLKDDGGGHLKRHS